MTLKPTRITHLERARRQLLGAAHSLARARARQPMTPALAELLLRLTQEAHHLERDGLCEGCRVAEPDDAGHGLAG